MVPPAGVPGGGFLTVQRQAVEAWAAAPATVEAVDTAAGRCRNQVGTDGYGSAFEQAVVAVLEGRRLPAPGGRWTTVRAGPGSRAAVDFTVTVEPADGRPFVAPVNLKTGAGGISLITLLRVASDPTWSHADETNARGIDYDRWLLELVAGRRRILPGRDYYLWTVETTATGRVSGQHVHGLLSRVDAADSARLALVRHGSRANVLPTVPGDPLPANMDVARLLGWQLLPTAVQSSSNSRAGFFVWRRDRVGGDAVELSRAAGWLLDRSDDELHKIVWGSYPAAVTAGR